MKKIFLFIVGVFLILIGLIGWILPIIPGLPLIFLGLTLAVPSLAFSLKHKWKYIIFKRDFIYFPEWKKQKATLGITTKFFPLLIKKSEDLGIEENQIKLQKALSASAVTISKKIKFPGRFVYSKQVHGSGVAVLEQKSGQRFAGFHRLENTDGMITDIAGLTLLVMTADCLPIFFYAPGWVGIVHAGWRGTQQKISRNAVDLLLEKSKCKPSEIYIIFGPSICAKHYQVGAEFKNFFSGPALRQRGKKYTFDLVRENREQIMLVGVPSENFLDTALCTVSKKKYFYSFRQEKEQAGRMISFIQLES